jgi:hypothetical protein
MGNQEEPGDDTPNDGDAGGQDRTENMDIRNSNSKGQKPPSGPSTEKSGNSVNASSSHKKCCGSSDK